MIEATLAPLGSANMATYPWSGPGPKTLLQGTEALGYFGEASPTEMLSAFKLRDQLNFQVGTDNAAWDGRWVKMFVDGKVIFFPTKIIATGITWNDLYNAGLVYGTDDNGKYPTATPTNQMRYVSAGNAVMKVRNFRAYAADPANMGGIENLGNTTNVDIFNGEWYRTIGSITTPRLTSYTGPWWPKYSQPDFLIPNSTAPFPWAQETRQALTTNGLTINNTQIAPSNVKTTALAWYPVLEVVRDSTYLFPLANVTGTGQGNILTVASAEVTSDFAKPDGFMGTYFGVAPANNAQFEVT